MIRFPNFFLFEFVTIYLGLISRSGFAFYKINSLFFFSCRKCCCRTNDGRTMGARWDSRNHKWTRSLCYIFRPRRCVPCSNKPSSSNEAGISMHSIYSLSMLFGWRSTYRYSNFFLTLFQVISFLMTPWNVLLLPIPTRF